jgi:hypothetical protein
MILIITLIILIIIIYLRYYTKTSSNSEIIQTNLYNLNYNILQERSPIVIDDKIVQVNDLIDKSFKHLYSKKYINLLFDQNVKLNLAKFAIFHNNSDNVIDVEIANPMFSNNLNYSNSPFNNNFLTSSDTDLDNIQSIKILLKPYYVLILPYKWLFKCSSSCDNYFLFDIMNLLIANWKNKIKG